MTDQPPTDRESHISDDTWMAEAVADHPPTDETNWRCNCGSVEGEHVHYKDAPRMAREIERLQADNDRLTAENERLEMELAGMTTERDDYITDQQRLRSLVNDIADAQMFDIDREASDEDWDPDAAAPSEEPNELPRR